MSKDKSANLRVTINVDLTDPGEVGIVRSLLRYCNVLSARTKPRWAMQDIMKESGTNIITKPGDKWAERKAERAPNGTALVPFPRFDDLNKAAAERNNKAIMCIHRIYPPTACSICSKSSVTHSRDTGGPVVNPTTPTTPYSYHGHVHTPYNWEEEKRKREATDKLLFEARSEIAKEKRMPMPLRLLPELGVEDGVVYDYEMW